MSSRRTLGSFSIAAVLALSFLAVPGSAHGGQGYAVRTDLRYGEATGVALTLDAYLPRSNHPVPGVIIIHGGGWNSGDKSEAAWLAEILAQNGFAAFSVNYRLAPQFPFPAAFQDVRTAVEWVRAHAKEFNVNPDLLATLGGSAGGHLAALVAVTGKGKLNTGSRVAVAVSVSGPMDMEELMRDPNPRVAYTVQTFLGCIGAPTSCNATAKAASPVDFVDPSDPPMFIGNGETEIIPFDQARKMDEALHRAGIPDQLFAVPGANHGIEPALTPTILAFLNRYLLGKGPAVSTTPSTGVPSGLPSGLPSKFTKGKFSAEPANDMTTVRWLVVYSAVLVVLGVSAGLAIGWAFRRRAWRS